MRRMWQGLLPVAHSSRAQDSAYGGVAAQVSRLQSLLQSALEFEDAPTHPHGHQALQLCLMWQSVSAQL